VAVMYDPDATSVERFHRDDGGAADVSGQDRRAKSGSGPRNSPGVAVELLKNWTRNVELPWEM